MSMKWYDMVWHGMASMKFKVCYSTISCFADVGGSLVANNRRRTRNEPIMQGQCMSFIVKHPATNVD